MEPLSAVSLAGTVIQLVDFGIKLVTKTSEIYNSAEGLEIRYAELESITQNLVSMCRRVSNRARNASASAVLASKDLRADERKSKEVSALVSKAISGDKKAFEDLSKMASEFLSEDEKALEALSTQCVEVGKEMADALQSAKVSGSHKHWKSVSSKQETLTADVHGLKQDVVDSEERIIQESRKGWGKVLDTIRERNYNCRDPGDVSMVSGLLSDIVTAASDNKRQETILRSLYYPRMQERREWIPAAHVRTYDWALESRPGDSSSWDSRKDWLTNDNGIYWISGKPGSGKSTLMKYIDFDERTIKYLTEWAAPTALVRSSFYFWNPGTSMQKSQLGLFQCLLYEMLNKKRSLIAKAFPGRWQTSYLFETPSFAWTESELSEAINTLAENELDNKFCCVIDGLDEFDGNHQALVDMLFKITKTSNIKILVSSRPWLVFQDAFEACPKLVLQDLTHNDIQIFASDSLYGHSRFGRLLSVEPDRAPRLVTDIVDRASGVFLWVYLVVRSLLDGLTNADRISDLQRRLEHLPTDLEQYFLHIMKSLDAFYLHQAAQFFRLALEARKPLSVLTFSYLDEDDPEFAINRVIKSVSVEEETARCEGIERRLNSRCKGLLEARMRRACDEYSTSDGVVAEKVCHEVDFLHRTVRDFLSTPTVHVQLVAPDTDSFNANLMLAEAFVAQIKGLRCATHAESNFQSLWSLVLETLHHMSRVADGQFSEWKIALLDELDRAAGHFRHVAIVKQSCSTTAHWANTGYRFGLNPEWNNDLLTLCVQFGVSDYVKAKVRACGPQRRGGLPLLAYALMERPATEVTFITSSEQRALRLAPHQPSMVKLLLEQGANPNEHMPGYSQSIWSAYLALMDRQFKYASSLHPQISKEPGQDVANWFKVMKCMLMHAADPNAQSSAGRSVLSIARQAFDGRPGCDISELEDLVNQESLNLESYNLDALKLHDQIDSETDVGQGQKDFLSVPESRADTNHQRSDSRISARSDISAFSDLSTASWRRPMEGDLVMPLHSVEIKEGPNPEMIANGSSKIHDESKVRGRFGTWLRRKKGKS